MSQALRMIWHAATFSLPHYYRSGWGGPAPLSFLDLDSGELTDIGLPGPANRWMPGERTTLLGWTPEGECLIFFRGGDDYVGDDWTLFAFRPSAPTEPRVIVVPEAVQEAFRWGQPVHLYGHTVRLASRLIGRRGVHWVGAWWDLRTDEVKTLPKTAPGDVEDLSQVVGYSPRFSWRVELLPAGWDVSQAGPRYYAHTVGAHAKFDVEREGEARRLVARHGEREIELASFGGFAETVNIEIAFLDEDVLVMLVHETLRDDEAGEVPEGFQRVRRFVRLIPSRAESDERATLHRADLATGERARLDVDPRVTLLSISPDRTRALAYYSLFWQRDQRSEDTIGEYAYTLADTERLRAIRRDESDDAYFPPAVDRFGAAWVGEEEIGWIVNMPRPREPGPFQGVEVMDLATGERTTLATEAQE